MPAGHADATPISVMVVDDSMTFRNYLEEILRDHYQIRACRDGMEAVEAYREARPEICLLDMNMPRMDGLEVIRHVRRVLGDQDLFILVLTSDDTSEQKSEALHLGANDYLVKPFDALELLARVRVAERQVRLTRSLREANTAMSREIEEIARLQRRLLPASSPRHPGIKIQSLYLPSDQASGDYFDYFFLPDGNFRVVMADVSGHGAKAAFIMSMVRTMIRFSGNFESLGGLFELINEQLRLYVGEEGDFVTLFVADIRADFSSMVYVNAGHAPGMLLRRGDSPLMLRPAMPALGVMPCRAQTADVPLEAGSVLFLFTDGCYEWEVAPGEVLGLERFWDRAASFVGRSDHVLDDIFRDLGCAGTPDIRDDVSVLRVQLGLIKS
ncbi:Serine phosphatase RsbU, regulator of sigma subunit [Desulfonatronum thiosulfatophilum]|uniref:Serine phosphatase RsbU, regulator of sigma subunit n=1 Tax=Desulfonatronum thiosulfatophilum TaxID=617002 RepID=A0A1G6C9M7_9BACT|nr:SpoIIE family protein phosphatase [Desulfonatronum thiosulfatophilum]SDB29491.1 Serine phosphatase RsbU, regulator of sigma subunit [Desulfonatronum thiosulfatophilum]